MSGSWRRIGRRKLSTVIFCLFGLAAVAACDLAPAYKTPVTATPAVYKEAAPQRQTVDGVTWKTAQPLDAAPRGAWWSIFGDAILDGLEDRATAANQEIKAAIARLDQARSVAAIARAAYYPILTGNANATRDRLSKRIANTRTNTLYNDFLATGDLTYEVDLWGRVRNSVVNAEDQAKASAGDLASLTLSIHAELANDYFTLRGDDAEQNVLDTTAAAYQRAYQLTLNRFQGGAAAEADVDQAETQFQTVKTQAADTRLKRAQLEHAIAILIGVPPSDLTVVAVALDAVPPVIPSVLPADLLQRRPDIAAAERRVAAANAEIGVARAAFYPSLTLGGDFGFEASSIGKLFSLPARLWSLGPSSAFTIFDAGERNAVTEEAKATFNEAAANYRQSVLTAYGEVEDNLAGLRLLAEENTSEQAGVVAATRSLTQARLRYVGGIVTYLEVANAQNVLLQAQVTAVDVTTRRMTAAVSLVKAMGGGWQAGVGLDVDKAPTSLAEAPLP